MEARKEKKKVGREMQRKEAGRQLWKCHGRGGDCRGGGERCARGVRAAQEIFTSVTASLFPICFTLPLYTPDLKTRVQLDQ